MPLSCTIDPGQKLVTVTANGDAERAEFEALLDTMRAAADRPMRVFGTSAPARRWLKSLKPPPPARWEENRIRP